MVLARDGVYRGAAPPPPPPPQPRVSASTAPGVGVEAAPSAAPPLRMWTTEAVAELLTRRARRQHDPAAGPQREHAYDSSRYNAWSGKSARNRDRGRDQTRAVTRCDAIADCGRTRGDDRRATTICLHFARGCCSEGDQCEYLHRLPTARDDAALSPMCDIFGREKHRDERNDNGGVGSFLRNTRTLYVYYGGAGEWGRDRVLSLLEGAFAEWGPVEHVHAVPTKCIGFVRFSFRASAEFAKEAMAGQTLSRKNGATAREALNVRWANDDPNPTAQHRVKREREESVADAVARAEARMPEERRVAMRLSHELCENKQTADGTADLLASYPDTDAQYPDAEKGDAKAAEAGAGFQGSERVEEEEEELEFDPEDYPVFDVEEVISSK